MWLPLAIWIGLWAAAFVALVAKPLPISAGSYGLLAVGGVALVARLVPIMLYPDPVGVTAVDIQNYHTTAAAILDRRDVYALPIGTYPYPPLHLYVFAAAKAIADASDASFFSLVRIPQTFADVGTALLVTDIIRRLRGHGEGLRAGLLYAACPLPILATVYHGQFDAVSLFFASLAFWAFLRGAADPRWFALSASALAFGSLEKVWPALLLPLFLAALPDHQSRIRYAAVFVALCGAVTGLYLLAFNSSVGQLYDNFDGYLPIHARFSGLGLVVNRTFGSNGSDFLNWFVHHGRQMSLVAGLAANTIAIALRLPLARSIVLVLCAVFLTSPEAHAYHLIWILPFAFIVGDRGFAALLVAVAATPYAITLLLAGGMFLPPHPDQPARWLVGHAWWLEYTVWYVLAAWGLWSLLLALWRVGREQPIR